MPVSQENLRSAFEEIMQDSKIQEAKYAQIITTQEQRDEAAMPERLMIYPRQLVTFPNHPFYIRDDEDMSKLKESIMHSGIRTPIEVIRTGEKNERGEDTFYIVAGHRRTHVARQIFPEDHRLEVRIHNMTMDEAIVAMTESNLLTRENILPCERGNALRMEVEARERITGRPENGTVAKNVRTRDLVGETYHMNGRSVQRYIRLAYLIPELQTLIDDNKIGMMTGVELSYLSEKEQRDVWDEMELTAFEHYPSKAQAVAMRKLSKAGTLDMDGHCRHSGGRKAESGRSYPLYSPKKRSAGTDPGIPESRGMEGQGFYRVYRKSNCILCKFSGRTAPAGKRTIHF